jgi:O-antigen/teichoic acid export membrane protein
LFGFLLGAVTKCALVVVGAPLIWFAVSNALESLVIAAAYWVLLRKSGVTVALGSWDFTELKRLVLDGKTMMLSGLTVVIYSRLDVLAIGSLISKEALGPYAMAASMCGAWNMVGMSVAQAWAPHISTAKARDAASYIAVLRRFLLVSLLVPVAGASLCCGWKNPIHTGLVIGTRIFGNGH